MTAPQQVNEVEVHSGHEPILVSVQFVVIGTIGLLALIGLTLWAMGRLSLVLAPPSEAQGGQTALAPPTVTPQSTMGLNPSQAEERLEQQKQQREWLDSYAWLDDELQTARIPIDRAIKIIEQRGFPAAARAADLPPGGRNTLPRVEEIAP